DIKLCSQVSFFVVVLLVCIMLHPQCCLLQVYKPLRTFIALVGLEIWTNGDLISVTPPAGANLDAFMKWRNSELVTRIKHDNAHLISGIDFEGPTVGLAFIGTLCSGHSVGVVQDHSDAAIAVGATLSHEMGHNLGMDHDDSSGCLCSDDIKYTSDLSFPRCAARISVWICRQHTETPTVQQNAQAML
uniref:ADAM metallopeptidase domain 28 n=1 Tax=Pundamilia nyererei TaxID=303518 RepID=A0A3B4FF02_9CICH